MKFKGMLIAASVGISITVCGCGLPIQNAIPEMDEETRMLIVNYAADTIEKYDTKHQPKLMTLEAVNQANLERLEAEAAAAAEAERAAAQKAEKEREENEKAQKDKTASDVTVEDRTETLDSALALDGISVAYSGYELKDSYPDGGVDTYFSMEASKGNKLAVFYFSVTNTSQAEQRVDMIGEGIRFKMEMNGEIKAALATMLLNDFSNYQETLAPGQTEEVVIICEVPEDKTVDTSNLKLLVRNTDEIHTVPLY